MLVLAIIDFVIASIKLCIATSKFSAPAGYCRARLVIRAVRSWISAIKASLSCSGVGDNWEGSWPWEGPTSPCGAPPCGEGEGEEVPP